ncbi:DorsalB, partial [Operophtera brumata]
FRYECEGRSAGSIPGANTTAENKTYPTLRIKDYVGPCTIVASCVTKDEPYSNTVQFKNLGIQCVKKKDVDTALQQRAQLRVDPFRSKTTLTRTKTEVPKRLLQ